MKNFENLLKIVDLLSQKSVYGGGQMIITINPQHDNHYTVEEELEDKWYEDQGQEYKDRCIKRNRIIDIQLYPTTQVGFYNCFSDDIEDAASLMIEALKGDTQEVRDIVESALKEKTE
jgi:hypothetical protein